MSVVTIKGGGSFSRQNIRNINSNFASLAAASVGGTLTNGYMIVGNGSNVATGVLMSGDVTITNAGVAAIKTSVSLTTPAIGAATGASVVLTGDCRAATFHAGATAGVTAGPFTSVSSIQTIGGIVTALTGT
jgi:hypothetical protein